MDYFQSHAIKPSAARPNEYELILYLNDYLFEFAEELGQKQSVRKDILSYANQLIKQKYPSLKVNAVKIMIGGIVMSSISLVGEPTLAAEPIAQQSHVTAFHQVLPGDTLWSLSKKYQTTVDLIKQGNQLTSDVLRIGQTLVIPKAIHTILPGDTLYSISRKYGTSVEALKEANRLSSTTLTIGKLLIIPIVVNQTTQTTSPTPVVTNAAKSPTTHKVVAGDTLYSLARKYQTTVAALKQANQLTSDVLMPGQTLLISIDPSLPSEGSVVTKAPVANTITNTPYTVQAGDTIWSISLKFGTPQAEVLRANGLTATSPLSIGQQLTIPVHQIAVKPTVSAKHGELLDWWTEAQYVFSIGKTAKVTDLATGKSFTIKRTIGANHADSETLTVADTTIAKSIWGGFSWKPRAVVVEVDGRKLAASMSFYPHEREFIMDNGITGHFDVYFSNSTRHVDGKADPAHQAQVEIAAGIR